MDFQIAMLLGQDGVVNGAVYALLALALVLVFSVTRVIFVPQGEFVTFGAMAMAAMQAGKPLALAWLLLGERFGWRTGLAIALSFAGVLVLGFLLAGCTAERVTEPLTSSPSIPIRSSAPVRTAVDDPAIAIETPFVDGEVGSPVSVTGTDSVSSCAPSGAPVVTASRNHGDGPPSRALTARVVASSAGNQRTSGTRWVRSRVAK